MAGGVETMAGDAQSPSLPSPPPPHAASTPSNAATMPRADATFRQSMRALPAEVSHAEFLGTSPYSWDEARTTGAENSGLGPTNAPMPAYAERPLRCFMG